MFDIIEIRDEADLGIADTVVPRAANLISTQINSIDYWYDWGVDLKFFVFSDLQIQRASFKAHLIERMAYYQINVNSIIEEFDSLFMRLIWDVSGTATEPLAQTGVTEIVPVLTTEAGELIATDTETPIGV